MKIIITGAVGHISKPLTQELVSQGHSVTVISSNADRQREIEALGAKAAIGGLEDLPFLITVFTGADVVYCMIPPGNYLHQNFDMAGHYDKIANNYAAAILQSGVKRVIHLSSIGGDMPAGNGMLVAHHKVETALKALPRDIAITTMRPTAFYYNLLGFLHTIKTQGAILSNYGQDDKCPWVSPLDIATAVAEEINGSFTDRKIRYVASEVLSCKEIASILGAAIGKPDLQWQIISDEQMLQGMLAAGVNPIIAKGLTAMNNSIHTGKLLEDYYRHQPTLGKTKMKDFAKEFAAVYNQQD